MIAIEAKLAKALFVASPSLLPIVTAPDKESVAVAVPGVNEALQASVSTLPTNTGVAAEALEKAPTVAVNTPSC